MARILDFSHAANCSSSLRSVAVLGKLPNHRAKVEPETPVAMHNSFCDLPMAFSLFLITSRSLTMLSEYNNRCSAFMFLPFAFTQKYLLINAFICVSILAQTQTVVKRSYDSLSIL